MHETVFLELGIQGSQFPLDWVNLEPEIFSKKYMVHLWS